MFGGSFKRRGSVAGVLLNRNRGVSVSHSATRSSTDSLKEMGSSGWDVMGNFLNAIRNISSEISPDEAAEKVIEETCSLLCAERSSLFFVDADAGDLILVVAKEASNIHIPIGTGIAGSVAATGDTVNIPNAYEDDRFDSTHDKETGFKTRAVLATAVRDPDGDIVAVLQCINKVDPNDINNNTFTKTDEILLEHMASHVGIVLRNAKLYESERAAKQKIGALLEVIRMIHSNASSGTPGGGSTGELKANSTTSLIFTLSNRSHDLVDADRCTLYLVDRPSEQLVVMQGDVDFRFPMNKGIAGLCVTEEHPIIINDAYSDSRFNQEMDKKTGYRTRNILCMPIYAPSSTLPDHHRMKDKESQLIGVLQLINKIDEDDVFGDNDIELMETLLTVAGPILGRSKFFFQPTRQNLASDESAIGGGLSIPNTIHMRNSSMMTFAEEEEEEEDA